MSLAPTATVAPLAAAETVRVVVRSILAIAAICLVCAATLGGRYLAFEYGHGSSGMASRLFDPLS